MEEGDGEGHEGCGELAVVEGGSGAGGQLGQVGHEVQRGVEEDEGEQCARQVEEEVRAGSFFGRGVGGAGCDVGGEGGAYVQPQDKGRGDVESYPAAAGDDHDDGHDGRGDLDDDCECGTDEYENQDGEEPPVGPSLHGGQQGGVLTEVGQGDLQELEADQEDAEADDELADGLHPVAFHQDEWRGQSADDEWDEELSGAGVHAQQDKPRGDGGAYVGTHHHGDGAGQGEEP